MSLKDHFSSEGTISNYIISCLDFLLHFVFFVCFLRQDLAIYPQLA